MMIYIYDIFIHIHEWPLVGLRLTSVSVFVFIFSCLWRYCRRICDPVFEAPVQRLFERHSGAGLELFGACVCVYVCVYVCMPVCLYVYMSICMYLLS